MWETTDSDRPTVNPFVVSKGHRMLIANFDGEITGTVEDEGERYFSPPIRVKKGDLVDLETGEIVETKDV